MTDFKPSALMVVLQVDTKFLKHFIIQVLISSGSTQFPNQSASTFIASFHIQHQNFATLNCMHALCIQH